MKHFTFILLLCLLSTASTGQTCDSVKRQAVVWVIERNECRELLILSEEEIKSLRTSDSLTRLALDKYKHSTDVLGKALVKSEQDKKTAESQRDQWKTKARRRLWLLPVGVVVGFVVAVII